MQTTLPDAILNIVLGVVSGLLVVVFPSIPRYWSLGSTWFAERSKRSAIARIRKLTAEVRRLDAMRADPNQLVARMTSLVGELAMFLGLAVLVIVLPILTMQIEHIRIVYLSDSKPPKNVLLYVMVMMSYVVSAVAFFRALFIFYRLRKWGDLDRRERFLQQQIKKLGDRWGVVG
jgi:hypothetical protein